MNPAYTADKLYCKKNTSNMTKYKYCHLAAINDTGIFPLLNDTIIKLSN